MCVYSTLGRADLIRFEASLNFPDEGGELIVMNAVTIIVRTGAVLNLDQNGSFSSMKKK